MRCPLRCLICADTGFVLEMRPVPGMGERLFAVPCNHLPPVVVPDWKTAAAGGIE